MGKKLVLFLVEGKSDKVSLEGVVRAMLNKRHEPYFILQSDITSDNHVNASNITKNLQAAINRELSKRKVTLNDVAEIIHIIDMDATYIDEGLLEENPLNYGSTYFATKIVVYNKARIATRNAIKRANIEALIQLHNLNKIAYRLYYFSINLEHVLHGNANACTIRQKIYLSNKFDDEYCLDVVGFLNLLSKPDILRFKSYEESWQFIQQPTNALLKASNLFFALADYLLFLNYDEKVKLEQKPSLERL